MSLFNGLARVNLLSFLSGGQAVSNTFYISAAGAGAPPSYADMGTLSTDLYTWLGTQYRALLDTSATLQQIKVSQVVDPTTTDVALENVDVLAVAGTRTPSGVASPDPLCALLSLRTPNASRRFRGHLFMPPSLNRLDQSGGDNFGATAYMTAVAALGTKLLAGSGASPSWTGTKLPSYSLVIYSHRAASLGLASVALTNNVTSNSRVHWLRSREKGTT